MNIADIAVQGWAANRRKMVNDMPRYIDAEHLMQKLSRMIDYCEKNKDKKFNALNVLFQVGDAIMDCPTADVVPKSEVERLNKKIDVLKRDRYQVFPDGRLELLPRTDLDKIKAEVAGEIFEEIENAHEECIHIDPTTNIGYLLQSKFELKLAELKKKYTEGAKLWQIEHQLYAISAEET
jgi:hypothetical protein